jgi:outer membrane protein OmpA-like peptidoglycan-associated protein
MRKYAQASTSIVIVAIAIFALSACEKHPEAPPAAAVMPPPPPPAAAPTPPSADDQLQSHLSDIGASSTDRGWVLSFSTASFMHGAVTFASEDDAKITKLVALLKDYPDARVLIDAYAGDHRSGSRDKELTQMHANAVMRKLTAGGLDPGRVQAQGEVAPGTSKAPDAERRSGRLDIVISDAEGQFRPSPVKNS